MIKPVILTMLLIGFLPADTEFIVSKQIRQLRRKRMNADVRCPLGLLEKSLSISLINNLRSDNSLLNTAAFTS